MNRRNLSIWIVCPKKADNPLKKDDKKLKPAVFKFGLFLAIYLFVAAVLSFGLIQADKLNYRNRVVFRKLKL